MKIEKLRAALVVGAERAIQLNRMQADHIIVGEDIRYKVIADTMKLGYHVRDVLMAEVEAKLVKAFDREEATRLSEYSTPVRVLNEMLRAHFCSDSNNIDAIFPRLARMVKFADAVLKGEWDPFKWRKSADAMRYLNDRSKQEVPDECALQEAEDPLLEVAPTTSEDE